MTEHLTHIFIAVAVSTGLLVGLTSLLVYLDKRGVNTHRGRSNVHQSNDPYGRQVDGKSGAKKKRRRK